jgi:energy-coupling factor transporter ATP-binding protein EcfA2
LSALVLDHVWGRRLKDVSLRLAAGVNVVIGDESDGTSELVALCAGVRAPLRGRVQLDGLEPSSSPACRRRVASLLADERDEPHGDVRGWLRGPAASHGVTEEAVLEACRVRADRALASLSLAEWRELACAVALAHPDPGLVVLHEPLAACPAGDTARVFERIAGLAQRSIVLITTGSLAAARYLTASATYLLDRGLCSDAPSGAWPGSLTPGLDTRLWVEADSPRVLVAALAQHPDVTEIDFDERSAGRISLRGPDLERLASVVVRAAVSAGVEVRLLQARAEDLDAVRAAATGQAQAAYRAAQARPRGAVDRRERS